MSMSGPDIATLCILGVIWAIAGYSIYRSYRHDVVEYLLADKGICNIADGVHCYFDIVKSGSEIVMKKAPMPAVSVDVRRDGESYTSVRLEGRGHTFDDTIDSAVILVP